MIDCNDAWECYCLDKVILDDPKEQIESKEEVIPKCSDLYISTTTKISYLTQKIELAKFFWELPVIPYNSPECGILKKQMKLTLKSTKEVEDLYQMLKQYDFYNVQHITYIVNEDKNIYKDIRKVNVGLCEKDILSLRSKKKSAFYNCFVLILRLWDDDDSQFKEAHVKVFNTGKLELPGIKSKKGHIKILTLLCELFNRYCSTTLDYLDTHETVLINSNFTCGYCLNREKLVDILREKYNIETSYDPCSYPGIMSKIYVNSNSKLSFMIFRTGSVLIVGKCNEDDIYLIYNKLSKIFHEEYSNIRINIGVPYIKTKVKNPRMKKCYIYI